MLLRSPRFSLLAVITLALGIGANTIVFSVVDAWLLRPLPFRAPEQLAAIWESEAKNPSIPATFAPWRHFQEWNKQSQSFEELAGYFWRDYTITGDGGADSLLGQMVTENYFSVLGVNAIVGRTFNPDDLNRSPAAVLGYGF